MTTQLHLLSASPRGLDPRAVLSAWARRSQQQACHNAMVSSTVMAEARHEREGVAEDLRLLAQQRGAENGHAATARRRARSA